MPKRRTIGAAVLGIALLTPMLVFAQAPQPYAQGSPQPRYDANTLKTHVAPPGTAPKNSLPVLPPAAIVPRDRSLIQNYYRTQANKSGHCPPGLAKRNDGCQPPGEQRRATSMGAAPPAPVPAAPPPPAVSSAQISPLPRPLLERLTAAPNGYSYGYSNGSVVLYATGSRAIADSAPAY
jgi:hypothetical protein